ncbi:MAG: SpoIIE family protein phosphatase [Acidobacteria bacterium]|nr:SpoIIE family protein phosphatase [Acidobacteriota bacterium]
MIPIPATAAPAATAEPAEAPPAIPLALVVGDLPLLRGESGLGATVDARPTDPGDALHRIESDSPELVLLDGRLPEDTLTSVLERVGHPERPDRPAVIVVTEGGRRTHVESRLIDHADDFVNGALGPEVLLARIRTALRVRAVLGELARKNAELETLSARLEKMAGRMAQELRLASQLQRALLPPPLHHPRLDLAAEFIPAREIGGDFYDVVSLDHGRLAVTLADVMGKGVPAALLAANLKACLRAQVHEAADDPGETIARVNRIFWDVTPRGLFATLFFGIFDFEEGRLAYVNAGHEPGVVVRADAPPELLDAGGTVIGLFEDSTYATGETRVTPDDRLVLFSDGLADRSSPSGELFGARRLREAAVNSGHDAVRIALYSLLGEVQGWSGGRPAEDDQTLIVAQVR